MTGRPYTAIDDLQHAAMDDLYAHDERLALLETGFGKTLVAMTVGQELIEAGVVKRPIVFAPLRVSQNTWPQERLEWDHLKHVKMVEWGGAPEDWTPSPWRDSRVLWGQRTTAENLLPGVEKRVRTKLDAELEQATSAAAGAAYDSDNHGAHVVEYYRLKYRLNPNQIREAVEAARTPLEARLARTLTQERVVNKALRKLVPPEGVWHVTSFENVEWFCSLYDPGESPFDLWIADETGKIARNPKSPRYKALRKYMPMAKIRWGLNATPAPEGAEDLFGQVQLIAGKRLWGSSFHKWRQKYFTPADYMAYAWRLQIGAFDLLMADLNTVAFRVPAEKLAYQKNITHRQILVDLPPKARAAYAEMEKTMAVELATLGLEHEGDPVVAMSEAAASQKLRQITQGYLYELDAKGRRTVHMLHDEKTQALAELLDSMGREPLLIAYEFDQDLENIRKVFKNVPYLGQGVSAAQASENIVRWNKRELPALALHHASASHGLNLQYGGHHICWLALPWGYDPYKQTNERIDRRGQKMQCYGHHIIARASKDQRVSDVLVSKEADQAKIISAIRSV